MGIELTSHCPDRQQVSDKILSDENNTPSSIERMRICIAVQFLHRPCTKPDEHCSGRPPAADVPEFIPRQTLPSGVLGPHAIPSPQSRESQHNPAKKQATDQAVQWQKSATDQDYRRHKTQKIQDLIEHRFHKVHRTRNNK